MIELESEKCLGQVPRVLSATGSGESGTLEANTFEDEAGLARGVTASDVDRGGAPSTIRRAGAIIALGRAAATIVPITAIVLAVGSAAPPERLEALVVQCMIWSVAAGVGYSAGGATLTALGPRVAVARGVLLGMVLSGASESWLPGQNISVGTTLFIGVTVFAVGAWWESFALRHIAPATRLLIIGAGTGALTLINEIREGRGFGYEVVGVVQEAEAVPDTYGDVRVLGPVADLQSVIALSRPDIVVLAPGPDRPQTFGQLLEAAEAGFRVVELAQFYEHAYGRVPVVDITRAWFMSVLHLYQRPYSRLTKRTVDLAGAGLLLVLCLPLFPVLALLVRLSEGPLLLRQIRLGEHGRLFTMYKFRTMAADAEASGEAVWAADGDTRITRAGVVMRRLRLDELPQLWNVARGEMSLVGPRPERPEFIDELTARVPYWTRRHLVKPGITGWAQVRLGYTASADATSEKLSYDLWYIRHRSLTVDLAILLRTVAVVVRGDRKRSRPASSGAEQRPDVLDAALLLRARGPFGEERVVSDAREGM
jgi:exopolysaccharide biosynthesis polyprenyl glycosylphosphotransferase